MCSGPAGGGTVLLDYTFLLFLFLLLLLLLVLFLLFLFLLFLFLTSTGTAPPANIKNVTVLVLEGQSGPFDTTRFDTTRFVFPQ